MTQTGNDHSNSGQRQADSIDAPAVGHAAVLQRIIGRSKSTAPARQTPEEKTVAQHQSVERMISTALGRSAERLYALPIFIQDVGLASATLAELPELLPEQALLSIVEGRGSAIGVVALSPAFVASVIEMQAIGRVSSREVRHRKPTRTDASISADFVNTLLSELGKELSTQANLPMFSAFSYASFLDDPRPLMLMLEDVELTRVTLNFRIGAGGQRDGTIVIALPAPRLPDQKPRSPEKALITAAAGGAANRVPTEDAPVQHAAFERMGSPAIETLAVAMQEAPVHLVGILCRKKVSLGTLRNLAPGTLIPLPPAALDDARIETLQGQLLAQGRLGEADGYHAIRLRAPGSHDQTSRVMRHHATDTTAGAVATNPSLNAFPHIDISQPDAFRSDPTATAPSEARSFQTSDGAAALDITMPKFDVS